MVSKTYEYIVIGGGLAGASAAAGIREMDGNRPILPAGAHEPYDYMPYFFSGLFEFGYEAVGEVDSSLETYAGWTGENRTGTIYYLKDGRVRGAMMCGIWGKVDQARELIKMREHADRLGLSGAIR
ncbi:MAG: hypothetical protein M0022_09760 [Desulfobacteraceae bacterium]|nr:hypothetical protein [Desulfobacteraceae bacterium]